MKKSPRVMRPLGLFGLGVAALGALGAMATSCGVGESAAPSATHPLPENAGALGLDAMLQATTTPAAGDFNFQNLSITLDETAGPATIDNAGIPPANVNTEEITLTFTARISIRNPDTSGTFNYNNANWGVAFYKVGANGEVVGEPIRYLGAPDIVVEDGTGLSGTQTERTGKVVIKIDFGNDGFPEDLAALAQPTQGSGTTKSRLILKPFYAQDAANKDGTKVEVDTGSKFLMQNDSGAILAGGRVVGSTSSDSQVSVLIANPTSLAAQEQKDGQLSSSGNSSIGGYLVMYWKDEDCKKAGAGWNFRANPVFLKSGGAANFSCRYPGIVSSAGACNLGCATQAQDTYFGRSQNQVALPLPATIPAANSEVGNPGGSCYRVKRVSGSATNFVLSGLENGKDYGVAFWVLDSAGNPGLTASNCFGVQAIDIPLATSKKDPGAKKTESDCFFVTAAAGDVFAPSVHYWRIVRDLHLRDSALHRWYTHNGPSMAAWLDAHPDLKPYFNSLLTASGKAIVDTDLFVRRMGDRLEDALSSAWEAISGLLVSEARASVLLAQAPDAGTTPETGDAASQAPSTPPSAEASPAQDASPTPDVTATPTPMPTPVSTPTPTPMSTPTPTPAPTDSAAQSQSEAQTEAQGYGAADPSGKRAFVAAPGVPSSNFYVLAGTMEPTDDKDLFDEFYKKGTPFSLRVGQTFTLLDAAGELGLGAEATYLGASGVVPNSYGPPKAGKKIGFYAFGVNVVADYRLRIGEVPWFAPRVAVFGGMERFREESDLEVDEAAQNASTGKADDDDPPRPRGYSAWNPRAGARLVLEMSLFRFFDEDYASAKFGYGLEDLTLDLFGAYEKSFADKTLATSGIFYGGGISFKLL